MKDALIAFVLAAGLAGAVHAEQRQPSRPPVSTAAAASPVLATYGKLVHASYQDALDKARDLQQAVDAFLNQPSESGLQAARQAWLAAREFYGQTEAFRFYGGPIDGRDGPEPRLNAWPVDESYIDRVQGRPQSGLINDREFVIDKKSVAAKNERGGEENIAVGWHAIEFLLWGQDLSEDGPGNRSFEDYVDGKAPNADRRRLYLRTVVELLHDDLSSLVRAWAPGSKTNYRAHFERGGLASVRLMLVGMGALSRGELAGERLEVALDTQQQEDEHSCFSDNTHRDFVAGITGIRNVWRGEFVRADGTTVAGPSLRQWITGRAPAVAIDVDQRIDAALQAALALHPPFDREIVGPDTAPGRVRALALLKALRAQADGLAEAAAALGLRGLAAGFR